MAAPGSRRPLAKSKSGNQPQCIWCRFRFEAVFERRKRLCRSITSAGRKAWTSQGADPRGTDFSSRRCSFLSAQCSSAASCTFEPNCRQPQALSPARDNHRQDFPAGGGVDPLQRNLCFPFLVTLHATHDPDRFPYLLSDFRWRLELRSNTIRTRPGPYNFGIASARPPGMRSSRLTTFDVWRTPLIDAIRPIALTFC